MIRTTVGTTLRRAQAALPSAPARLRLLVAVSGGEDSHALLHILADLRTELSLDLSVAHLDHGLRPESRKESEFVLGLGARYGVPVRTERAGVRPPKENLEAWARSVRYSFLEAVRKDVGAHFIVTAHHLNDQAETALFRLLTGRALTDARAIAEIDFDRHLVRPLLQVPKAEVEEYSIANRLDFVMDASNTDFKRSRSRIRHELLPLLTEHYNPQVVRTLGAEAERFGADEDYLEREARRIALTTAAASLRDLEPAMAWRVLAVTANVQLGEPAQKLGYRAFQEILALVRHDCALRRLDLGFGVCCEVSREEGARFFLAADENADAALQSLEAERLPVPGFVERLYPDGSAASIRAGVIVVNEELRSDLNRLVHWAKEKVSENDPLSYAVEYFDLERLPKTELTVRERKNGDRMRIFKRGERKVKKLFLEHELPQQFRDHVPVVAAGEQILWIPGVARGEEAPVGPESRYLLELRYARE